MSVSLPPKTRNSQTDLSAVAKLPSIMPLNVQRKGEKKIKTNTLLEKRLQNVHPSANSLAIARPQAEAAVDQTEKALLWSEVFTVDFLPEVAWLTSGLAHRKPLSNCKNKKNRPRIQQFDRGQLSYPFVRSIWCSDYWQLLEAVNMTSDECCDDVWWCPYPGTSQRNHDHQCSKSLV
jgi:hypothetical protein